MTVTEVMPANAPQTRRSTAERGAPGVVSKPCLIDQSGSHTMRSLLSIQYWSLDIHHRLVSCLGCSCIQYAPGIRRSLLCCRDRSCPLCCCCSALLCCCSSLLLLYSAATHTPRKKKKKKNGKPNIPSYRYCNSQTAPQNRAQCVYNSCHCPPSYLSNPPPSTSCPTPWKCSSYTHRGPHSAPGARS